MISANCNTVFDAMSYNKKHKLLAYAAGNSILIMDPFHKLDKVPKVLFSLKGHGDRVNAVSWINDRLIASVSSDKILLVRGCPEHCTNLKEPSSWTILRKFTDAHS